LIHGLRPYGAYPKLISAYLKRMPAMPHPFYVRPFFALRFDNGFGGQHPAKVDHAMGRQVPNGHPQPGHSPDA